MKIEQFKVLFENSSPEFNDDIAKEYIVQSIVTQENHPLGSVLNLMIAMEELNELTQAITKQIHFPEMDKTNLMEEMADVYLGFTYLQEIFDVRYEFIEGISKPMVHNTDHLKQYHPLSYIISLLDVISDINKLSQAIVKQIRFPEKDKSNLVDTMVGVFFNLMYLQYIFDIGNDDFNKAKNAKVSNLKYLIDNGLICTSKK